MKIEAILNEKDKKYLGEEIGSGYYIKRPEELDDDELRRRLDDLLMYPPEGYKGLDTDIIREEDLQEIYQVARKTIVQEMRNYIDKMNELWHVN